MTEGPLFVVESSKNRVLVYGEHVEKVFHSGHGIERKARREVAALRRLAGLEGVPALLGLGPDGRSLTLSRLKGEPLSECESVDEGTLRSLRDLVERILERGVARHSLPARDVIVHPDGSAGLVDFERSTLRFFPGDPFWLIGRGITRFHLKRLIEERAPQLLTLRERRWLRWQAAFRAALQRPFKLRRRFVRFVRARLG